MCPSCKSPQVRRSRRPVFRDRVMKFAGLQPYRCRECNRRFYLNQHQDEKVKRQQQRPA